jgi:hypothetical protein
MGASGVRLRRREPATVRRIDLSRSRIYLDARTRAFLLKGFYPRGPLLDDFAWSCSRLRRHSPV